MTLRDEIIKEIMTLVRPEPREMKPRPTIDELEKILNSADPMEIDLRPDGSVYARPPSHTTVGDVADAILRVIERSRGDAPEEKVSKPRPTNDDPNSELGAGGVAKVG